jgi:hypothetical protein
LRTGCKSGSGLSRSEFTETLLRRFEAKCGAADANGCIPWLGHCTRKGYGILRFNKDHHKTTAHRIAWVLKRGDLSPEILVLHRCDNPSCVNVEHLFIGSPQANTDDMVRKQRHSWRERTPWQKLKAADVERILDLRRIGHTQQQVADELKVSRPLISLIESGRIKHAARVMLST